MSADPIADLCKTLSKTLGEGAFENPSITGWAPTGSLILDMHLGGWKSRRGYPYGKVVDVFGRPRAGKSSMMLRCGLECQKQGGLVVFVNTNEQGFNPEWGIGLGLACPAEPAHDWMLINVFSLESMGDALEDIVKARYTADEPTIIIVDSVSAACCSAYTMNGKAVSDNTPAAANAKFMHELLRRGLLYYMSGSKVVILASRHQTDSPRMFAKDTVTHGSALEFYSWVRLKMSRTDMEDRDGGKAHGAWINTKVVRTKVGGMYSETSSPLYYNGGFNLGLENVQFLIDYQFIKKSGGGGYYEWEGQKLRKFDIVNLYNTNGVIQQVINKMVIESGGPSAGKKLTGKGDEGE